MVEHFRFHVLVLTMHLRKRKATQTNAIPVKNLN